MKVKQVNKQKTKRKKVLIIIAFVLLGILVTSVTTSAIVSHTNYQHNTQVEQTFLEIGTDGYLHNQGKTGDFRYGFFHSDKKGCGWIATYNALVKLGNPKPMASIIASYDLYGETLFGLLGTNPFAVQLYFETHGYHTTLTFNQSKFAANIQNNTASIIAYFSSRGGHFQFIEHTEGESYKVYNNTYEIPLNTYLQNHSGTVMLLISIR